jgi:hypothetical protein
MPLCNLSNALTVTQPASFAVNVSANQAICKGMPVTFTASGGEENYSWSPGNMSGPIVTFTPLGSTVYTVTGTDSAGCKVVKLFTIQISNCLGIEETTLQSVRVRNDISGNFILVTNLSEECRAELFDLNGHLKYTGVILQETEIDVSNLPSGIYVLKLSDANTSCGKRIILSK